MRTLAVASALLLLAGCASVPSPGPEPPAEPPSLPSLRCADPCEVALEFGVEPWMAVDPTNARHAVVVGMALHPGAVGHPWLRYATTTDGGETWAPGVPAGGLNDPSSPLGSYGFAADVMAAFTNDGQPLLVSLVGRQAFPFLCVAGAACRPDAPLNANFLDLAVWRSTDGGQTFPEGQVIVQADGPVAFAPGTRKDLGSFDREHLVRDPVTGTLHLFWARIRNTDTYLVDLLASRSADGGHTWSPPTLVAQQAYGAAAAAYGDTLLLGFQQFTPEGRRGVTMRSTDGGQTWGDPVVLGAMNGYGTTPVALWPRGGALRAAVAYADGDRGERLVLRVSEDAGATWDDGTLVFVEQATERRLPSMAVDPSDGRGALVAFQGVTGDAGALEPWAVPLVDGVAGDALLLSPTPTSPPAAFDYQAVDAAGGRVYAAWTNADFATTIAALAWSDANADGPR